MIRRYLKRTPSVTFRVGGKRIGTAPSVTWMGLEIDSVEPIPDYAAAELGLVPADGMSEAELRERGVTSWEYVGVGKTTG